MRRMIFVLLSILLLMMAGAPVSAQANLLTNPGFEEPYGGGYQRNTAQGWTAWVGNGNADFYPEQFGSVRGGANSQAIKSEFVFDGQSEFDVALYQTVSGIPVGSVVTASVWGSMWSTGIPDPANAAARLRIGIDPNGGTNPYDGDVTWVRITNGADGRASGDGWIVPYKQGSIQATTTGGNVTVFLQWKQRWGGLEQRSFFDDASLVINTPGDGTVPDTSGGSAAPAATAPPPPPASSFASPQGEREDGSVVHVVVSGNTLAAIAAAYGVTAQDILTLNPSMGDGRFIYIGQEIIIRPPTSEADARPISARSTTTTTPPIATTSGGNTTTDATKTPVPIATAMPATDVPPTETPAPPPTATTPPDAPVTLVADSSAGDGDTMTTSICVYLFEDVNQNRVQDQGEGLLAQGVINLKQGETALNTIMTDTSSEPRCFTGLASGEYLLEAEAPAGYGLTSSARLGVRVQSGESLNMPFGAAQGVAAVAPPPANIDNQDAAPVTANAQDEGTDSELLQNIGLIVFGLAGLSLVGGLVIALILRRSVAPSRRPIGGLPPRNY